MKNSMLLIGFLALVGCKDQGQANVDACNDYFDALECGDVDYSADAGCDAWDATDCDITEYFDCLADNFTCDDATGVADVSGQVDCLDKATCE